MNELEVGMYVRTKDGAIAKAEQIIDDEIHFDIKPIFSDGECLGYRWFYVRDVIKASYNIIDLIEVGDYVNGELVVRIEKDSFIKGQINLWTNTTTTNYWGDIGLSPIIDKNIKSIVTKEMMESMSYRVGD